MPAKWQKWMPFHIDSFYGSPWVQAMHPTAQAGYLKLLSAQWQTEDCTLPVDEFDLSILSGLSKWNLWDEHSKTILRHFSKLADGRLQNPVCLREWNEAKRVFEARQKGGKVKTPEAVLQQSSKQAHTRTKTETVTKTVKQESSGKPEVDPRHTPFRKLIRASFEAHSNGIECPWEGGEANALAAFLRSVPKLSEDSFSRLLRDREQSGGIVLTDRPRVWLGSLMRFASGPIDQWKLKQNGVPVAKKITTFTREEAAAR